MDYILEDFLALLICVLLQIVSTMSLHVIERFEDPFECEIPAISMLRNTENRYLQLMKVAQSETEELNEIVEVINSGGDMTGQLL